MAFPVGGQTCVTNNLFINHSSDTVSSNSTPIFQLCPNGDLSISGSLSSSRIEAVDLNVSGSLTASTI